MNRPESTEYAAYYGNYISKVNVDVIPMLTGQMAGVRQAVAGLPEEKGKYAYADGKWTIKEVLSHLIDGERIFAYRILRISRGDATPMEGFEQDDYIPTSNANNRSFADLLDELELERRANLLMIGNIDDEASKRMGIASGNPVSVRAIVFIMAGHVEHHLGILKERYLV